MSSIPVGSETEPVIVITGINGGLGQALAKTFLQNGMRVAGIGRQADPIIRCSSDRFAYWQANIADPDQVVRTFESIVSSFKRVDVLFNNAAVYPKVSFLEQSTADWANALAINVNGVAFCCHAALPIMISQGRGRIYNVGSFADLAPIAKSSAYSASKGALHALVKGVAADLAPLQLDVQIHEWIPGHLNTRMSDFTGIDPAISAGWALQMVTADNASRNGCIFENDREWIPAMGMKQRILRRLGLSR